MVHRIPVGLFGWTSLVSRLVQYSAVILELFKFLLVNVLTLRSEFRRRSRKLVKVSRETEFCAVYLKLFQRAVFLDFVFYYLLLFLMRK